MYNNNQIQSHLSRVHKTGITDWPADDLEYLGRCPVCASKNCQTLYSNMVDKIYGVAGRWTYNHCHHCRSAFLDPRPTKASIGIAYANYRTHNVRQPPPRPNHMPSQLLLALRNDYLNWKYGYDKRPSHPWGRLLMHLMPPFLRHEWDYSARGLPRPTQGKNRLLDVGCGNGDFLIRAEEAGWNGLGLDFDPVSVDLAKSRGLNVILGGIDKLALDDCTFQAVTHSHVIEHVHDPVNFLRGCLHVLAPGGVMWIATPNLRSIGHRIYGSKWHLIHPPNHLVLFSPASLFYALKKAGAKHIKLIRRGFHVGAVWASTLALQNGKSPFDVKLPKRLTPAAWFLECWDSLFPRFQEELIVTVYKK